MTFEKCGEFRLPTNIPGKVIEVKLYYSLGGWNAFTSRPEDRGYYVSACPMKIEGNWVSFIAFSGRKFCVKQVSRKSAKAEMAAAKAANDNMGTIKQMIQEVAQNNDLEVEL